MGLLSTSSFWYTHTYESSTGIPNQISKMNNVNVLDISMRGNTKNLSDSIFSVLPFEIKKRNLENFFSDCIESIPTYD